MKKVFFKAFYFSAKLKEGLHSGCFPVNFAKFEKTFYRTPVEIYFCIGKV